MTANDVIRMLDLEPLPAEGGFFKEIYRSRVIIPEDNLDMEYDGPRSSLTAIYFLITPEAFSAIHRILSDEIFHFYAGDPAEMLHLLPDGSSRIITIGTDLETGHQPQVIVPAGTWQGVRVVEWGQWTLLGTTVSPGYEQQDFELGSRSALIDQYPSQREMIEVLTR